MTKTRKRKKSVSDSRLMKAWRLAVLAHWNYTDPISGRYDPSGESLQCHHIVGRRHLLLRWDYRNGIPLTIESHQYAHTGAGNAEVRELVDADYLDSMERYTARDYFTEHGINDNEWRLLKLEELKGVTGESW